MQSSALGTSHKKSNDMLFALEELTVKLVDTTCQHALGETGGGKAWEPLLAKGQKGEGRGLRAGGRTEQMMGSGEGTPAWNQERGPENRGRCPSGIKSTEPWGWDRKRLRQAFSSRLGRNSRGSLSAIQEFHLVA